MTTVNPRSKQLLTVAICLGLVILAVLIFAVSAQGAARFLTTPVGYAPTQQVQEARQAVQDRMPPVLKPAAKVLAAPTRLPEAGGACYAEPGTPPASVLHRESKGNPKARNRSGAAGCWQFMPGTWARYGGYSSADQAPVHVQNARAKQVWAGGDGACHWRATTDQC